MELKKKRIKQICEALICRKEVKMFKVKYVRYLKLNYHFLHNKAMANIKLEVLLSAVSCTLLS